MMMKSINSLNDDLIIENEKGQRIVKCSLVMVRFIHNELMKKIFRIILLSVQFFTSAVFSFFPCCVVTHVFFSFGAFFFLFLNSHIFKIEFSSLSAAPVIFIFINIIIIAKTVLRKCRH